MNKKKWLTLALGVAALVAVIILSVTLKGVHYVTCETCEGTGTVVE